MHLSRSDAADTEVARRRLELLTGGPATDAALTDHRPDDDAPPATPPAAPPATPEVTRDPTEPRTPGRHAARRLPSRERLGGRVLDALPPTLRGRWGITAHHVTVLALLVVSAVALAAWWLVRAQPEPLAAMTSSGPMAPTASPASLGAGESDVDTGSAQVASSAEPSSPPESSDPADLVVHVAGKVRRPGIVSLPPGARVIEALQAAGGPRKGVDLSSLNLARVLTDGEQVVVGLEGATAGAGPPTGSPTGGTAGNPVGPVNLNTATAAQLEELPGVGPVTAASILDWRAEHGRFSTVEELLEVSGIGEATLADLRDLVTV